MKTFFLQHLQYLRGSLLPLLAWAYLCSSCAEDKVGESELQVKAEALKIDKADSVTLIISKDGHTKVRLRTLEFVQNDNAQPPYLDMNQGLFVEFFDDSLKVESTLRANKARFYPASNNILVKDSVVVVNAEGDTLKTQELVWNNKLQKFFSNDSVEIIRNGSSSFGASLEANKDLTWIRIYQQRGIVPVEGDQLPDADN
ncbi:MAG TPA: LPS export ABC transporter periplasmic protein LptC [Edaphocola sp.]|nr:LPS export ABC transporter periplasmic protein LptC [Edaphocola sp.]